MITHVSLVTMALAIALAASLQGAAAGPTPQPATVTSLLPQNVGIGLPTTAAVEIRFAEPMDRQSVADALTIYPATAWTGTWSSDGRTLRISPERRWETDVRYVVTVPSQARLAGGQALGLGQQVSFTTETAPAIADFRLHYVDESAADRVRAEAAAAADEMMGLDEDAVAPPKTTGDVSAATRISLGFSTPMAREEVERGFSIRPEVDGDLTWEGNVLVFAPTERLEPGARYTISVVGAHDERGNPLAGDLAFSFTTRPGAQVVKTAPKSGEKDVETSQAQLWFSQPMDRAATNAAFSVVDTETGGDLGGKIAWNEAGTQLTFTFDRELAAGHRFAISLADSARDADQNAVSGTWAFTTTAPPPPPPPPPPGPAAAPAPQRPVGPAPPADIVQFAVWQVNQARASYGFAPVVLDGAISQVASAHAWDMLNYGYFSHTGRDGSRVADRMRRAGIAFGSSGENLCYHAGIGLQATMEWCHSVFMAEPYPGVANHKANILSPNFSRVGIGIAQSGGKIYVVWNFAG